MIQGIPNHHRTSAIRSKSGFTLIELLTVIGIMALLATIVVAVIGTAAEKKKISQTKAELAQIETGIQSYYTDYGQYPPQNQLHGYPSASNPNLDPTNSAPNGLFYELNGTTYDPNLLTFTTRDKQQTLAAAQVQQLFNIGGFANAGEGSLGKSYLNLKPRQIGLYTNSSASVSGYVLAVTAEAPTGRALPALDEEGNLTTINPWRYLVEGATNNPSSYDLWAEIVVGDEVIVIGNNFGN